MRVLFLFLAFMIASCNNTNTAGAKDESMAGDTNSMSVPQEQNIPSTQNHNDITGCYIRVIKRDTIVLHLQQNGTIVSGKMNFDNYEKDGSSGEVSGVIENNTVKLWYDFQSEGMHSVMELYFRVADSSLVQGIGPVASKTDTSYFTDHSVITYPDDQLLNKVQCSEVPGKYL